LLQFFWGKKLHEIKSLKRKRGHIVSLLLFFFWHIQERRFSVVLVLRKATEYKAKKPNKTIKFHSNVECFLTDTDDQSLLHRLGHESGHIIKCSVCPVSLHTRVEWCLNGYWCFGANLHCTTNWTSL
jgi:hypothetical protein